MASSPSSLTVSRRRILSLAAGGGAMAAVAPARLPVFAQPGATTQTLPADDEFAGLVEIGGGRRLWLECRGEGGPTVILEAGYRSPASVWPDDLAQPDKPREMVLDEVARFTRVCAYE